VHGIKSIWGSGDIVPLIPNFGTRWRWVVNFMVRPLSQRVRAPGSFE